MNELYSCINSYYPLKPEAWHDLSQELKKVNFPKSKLLAKEGNICNQLYFLNQGCLRAYYNLDGKEITYWFGFENSFVTSFYSFISRKPGMENIQLLEDSHLWAISHDGLQKLFDHHHDIERLVRIIYDQYYIRLEERIMAIQFKSAKERYDQLLQNSPHVLQRIALGQIASYLGISQETLSRIRSQV